MAADAPPASTNPCCLAWQGKYIGMRQRRDWCKESRDLLQNAMVAANANIADLEKKLAELAAGRDTKDKDSAVKSSLEKEISTLKQNLREKCQEIKILQDQASSREREINKLQNLLKKETLRADNSEEEKEKVCKELDKAKALIVKNEDIKPHVPEVQTEISLVQNLLASEKHKTDSERKKAESEKKRADQYLSELEVLRSTAHKTSSDLLTLTSNLESVKQQLQFEKQKTLKEKKRADMESAKASEQMKLAEGLSKKFENTRARNEELKKEMELQAAASKVKFAEISAKLEEKIRLLEMNKKTAMDSKSRADDLTQQLQEARLENEGLKKQVLKLSPSQKSIHSVSPHKVRDLEKAEVRLLKKELKYERKCAKLSKKVAQLEQFQTGFQVEELGRIKLEFGSLMNRMKLLGEYFSKDVEGTTVLEKAEGCMKLQTLQSQKNCNGEKHSDARCHLVASSGSQEQAHKFSAQLIPKSGWGVSESVSGTISQLESPTGGSRKLQSSGVNSSATSFSDGQLLASQGREQVSVTTSAKTSKDKSNIQPTNSSMFQRVSDARKNGNPTLVAKNYVQIRQKESHKVVNEHSQKRKRMSEAAESRKHVSSHDRKKNLQIGEKLGTLQSMVVGGSSANCITVSKKRRVSCEEKTIRQNSLGFKRAGKTPGNIAAGSTQVSRKNMCLSITKEHDAVSALFLDDVAPTDCMKLLDLDNLEEENHYKMARESLLSPDLPHVDFLGGEIVNEEKRTPARGLDLIDSNGLDLLDPLYSSEAPNLNTQTASVTVKMPPVSTTLHGHIPKHFVVFSNIGDQNSIIKIFLAANNCMKRYPSITISQWAVPAILNSLQLEKNLLAQERICVLLSLLLHNVSVVSSTNIENTLNVVSFLDSFSKHIYDVMADTQAGGMLSEFLEELLHLLQDLLSEQRIFVAVKHSEIGELDLSIPVTLNGENIALVSRIALIDHLVAGSALLAAICTAQDRVGFIYEASFEILHKHSHEKTSVLLNILHVFAYISGEKMVSSSEHNLSIAVLKSIVMFLENRYSDTGEVKAHLHPGKNKCPFSDSSSSVEAVALMLVEILQEFSQFNTLDQSLISSLGSSYLVKREFSPSLKDFQCILTRDQSVTLCHLCDVLALLELIASYMAWDWTSVNIVAPLLKMMGMALPGNISVAIVSLLGQLGSIGVDASGYENEGISNIREKLSAFLQCEMTLKAGFAVQIATVSSLLKMIQFDFAIVLEGKTTMLPSDGHQSSSASVSLLAKWFSLLSDEQRAFTSEFLQSIVR